MNIEGRDEVTSRDRYHARAQIVAAIIGALLTGLIAGLVGGRKWEEKELASQIEASERAVDQLRAELGERIELIELLRSRVDAQDQTIKELQTSPLRTSSPQEPGLGVPVSIEQVSLTASEPEEVIIAAQDVAGITMSLKGCHRSGSRVTCDFIVLNHESDQVLKICAHGCFQHGSRLIDSQGVAYGADAAYLGAGYDRNPAAVLAWEVPLRAGIRFEGVDPRSRSIELLEVGVKVGFNTSYSVQFRDIPL